MIIYVSFDLRKYPRGRRGSPAKGVVGDEPSEGSNPSFSASSPQASCRLRRAFSFLCKAHLARIFAAPRFHKKSRSARLFGCKRPHYGPLPLPTFCWGRRSAEVFHIPFQLRLVPPGLAAGRLRLGAALCTTAAKGGGLPGVPAYSVRTDSQQR